MKAYVESSERTRSIMRVRDALMRYAPKSIKFTKRIDDADLVILHVNGRQDRNQRKAARLKARGQRYAIIQYAIRSTMRPSTRTWAEVWLGAVAVWSYLNIHSLFIEDGVPPSVWPNFYHAPLGTVEVLQWRETPFGRPYLVATSGNGWLQESVREVANATWRADGQMFHLGPCVRADSRITCMQGMDDRTLGKLLASCFFVSGLRRTEGFELPAAEGLVCGARPILFDREHYRHWYGELAEYIPEGTREEVIDALEALFRKPRRLVTESESEEAKRLFDWARIVAGFWERC